METEERDWKKQKHEVWLAGAEELAGEGDERAEGGMNTQVMEDVGTQLEDGDVEMEDGDTKGEETQVEEEELPGKSKSKSLRTSQLTFFFFQKAYSSTKPSKQ